MQASVIVACQLCSTGSIVVMHGLSYSKACGIFLDQGSNTCLPWQSDSLPLSHQGSPLTLIFVSSHARPLEVSLASQPLLCTWQKFLRTTIASSIRITSLESCPLQDLGTAVPQYLVSSLMLLRVSVCVCVWIPWLSSVRIPGFHCLGPGIYSLVRELRSCKPYCVPLPPPKKGVCVNFMNIWPALLAVFSRRSCPKYLDCLYCKKCPGLLLSFFGLAARLAGS